MADESHCVFFSDRNGNISEYNTKSPSTQHPSASHGNWDAASPDGMVVDYEMEHVESNESVSLSHRHDEALDYPESSSDFILKFGFAMHSDPTHQSSALSTVKPLNLHSNLDSLETLQDERFETCVCKSGEDFNCADSPAALELSHSFDMKVDTANCPFRAQHSIEQVQPLHAPGGLPPVSVRGGNTFLSCSTWTSPHSSKMHVRGIHGNRESFEDLQAPPSETLNTAHIVCSDVLMQTDTADIGIQCQSLGNVTKEYTDGTEQEVIGEKEIQTSTPVSNGMEVPNGSVLQEFYCVTEDEPHSETHSHSSYGQQEMGQNLRETLSNCHVDDECPVLPAFNKTRDLDSEYKVPMTKDPHVTSHVKDSEIQNYTLRNVPGQKFSLYEMAWDGNGRAISTNNTACLSTAVQQTPDISLTLSPVDVTEKCNHVENGPRHAENSPNLKGAPVNLSEPNLGKSATKTNTTMGSKVRKTKIISYPRPNFKNIKAKVISRSVLQPKDTSSTQDTAKPQISGVSPPPVPSKQLTVMNRTSRSDFNADKKAEILINKTDKQQFNKLITSQAVHVTTHSKNASLRVPRTTSATKSNREDVDKTGSSHAASETGSVAAFFQNKGILPVKMKSSEGLEVTYVPHIDQIVPEKDEKDRKAPMEKQELGKAAMNETFECKSLFVVSESCCLLLGRVKKAGILAMHYLSVY
ncbi:microtubule-associated tumor suppressor 1 isoform X1 [Sigmodon hispidus]